MSTLIKDVTRTFIVKGVFEEGASYRLGVSMKDGGIEYSAMITQTCSVGRVHRTSVIAVLTKDVAKR